MKLSEHREYRDSLRQAIDSICAEKGFDRKGLCKKMGSQMGWLTNQLYQGPDFITVTRICEALDLDLNSLWARVLEEKVKLAEINVLYICMGSPIKCGHSYAAHQTRDGHCMDCPKDTPCERWVPNPKGKES